MVSQSCGVCGAATLKEADYCHSCGASLSSEFVELEQPEQPAPTPPNESNFLRRLLTAAAVVGLLVGLTALLLSGGQPDDPQELSRQAATPPPTPSSPTPSTDDVAASNAEPTQPPEPTATPQPPRVFEPTLAAPLGWELNATFADAGRAVALVEQNAELFIYARPSQRPSPNGGTGLMGWVSLDGTNWESAGAVIPEGNLVSSVWDTPSGLLALGRSASGSQGTLWISQDGTEWTASTLPPPAPDAPQGTAQLQTAGENSGVLVVFGAYQPDLREIVAEALPAEVRDYFVSNFRWRFDGSLLTLFIGIPLGINVFAVTAEELGFGSEGFATVFSPPDGATVWTSSDGQDWSIGSLDAYWVESVSVTPAGDFAASGFGPAGPASWTSTDGLAWASTTAPIVDAGTLQPWDDGTIATRNRRASSLSFSSDGQSWTSLGLDGFLSPGQDWLFDDVSAGASGILVLATAVENDVVEIETPTEPIVVSKDGYVLTSFDDGNSVTLARDGTLILALSGSNPPPDDVRADFGAETVTFVDPTTGEALVTFSFDELQRAETDAPLASSPPVPSQMVLFSPDGEQWSVKSFDSGAAGQAYVSQVLLTEERVIAVIQRTQAGPDTPALEIWSAPVS